MFMPIAQGGALGAAGGFILNISSNTSHVNILTLAQAAGYDESTDDMAIIVNVASGVTVSASTDPAIRTGALNAASNLTINIASGASVTGFTGSQGANGSSAGQAGSAGGTGGDSIFFHAGLSSGTGAYLINNDGTISGGRGGGGGFGKGGIGGTRRTVVGGGKGYSCNLPLVYGASGADGSAGAAGGLGATGNAGTSGAGGSNPSTVDCPLVSGAGTGGAGGAGGAAGRAILKQGSSVTIAGTGTFNGAIV